MPLKAHIADDLMRAGIKVVFVWEADGLRRVYSPGDHRVQIVQPGAEPEIEPLHLGDDEARVLYEALGRYLGGTDDTRALRKDYEAERARVDKLIDAWIPRSS